MNKELFQDLLSFFSEAIENGYNYEYCLEKARKDFNLSNDILIKIHKLMLDFKWLEDNHYIQFEKDLKNIVGEE